MLYTNLQASYHTPNMQFCLYFESKMVIFSYQSHDRWKDWLFFPCNNCWTPSFSICVWNCAVLWLQTLAFGRHGPCSPNLSPQWTSSLSFASSTARESLFYMKTTQSDLVSFSESHSLSKRLLDPLLYSVFPSERLHLTHLAMLKLSLKKSGCT